MDKVAIFVDVQNIYYTVKERFNRHFNYAVFLDHATSGRKLVQATAYAIDRGDEKQIKFQQIIRNLGFEIKLKPYIQRNDGSTKGDWDVGITVDMLEIAEQTDIIVLASGDGDFDIVVQQLRNKHHVIVEVFGVGNLTASSLIEASSRFVPINEKFLLPA
jgi:uncharacterized LabA/DUF88 family protein